MTEHRTDQDGDNGLNEDGGTDQHNNGRCHSPTGPDSPADGGNGLHLGMYTTGDDGLTPGASTKAEIQVAEAWKRNGKGGCLAGMAEAGMTPDVFGARIAGIANSATDSRCLRALELGAKIAGWLDPTIDVNVRHEAPRTGFRSFLASRDVVDVELEDEATEAKDAPQDDAGEDKGVD